MVTFAESVVEEVALAWLESIAWPVAHDPDIAPDTLLAERRDHGEVVVAQPPCDALPPKLISGELRVRGAVKNVEGVT